MFIYTNVRSAIRLLVFSLLCFFTSATYAALPKTTTSINVNHNRVLLPLNIGGTKINFLLDTGASTSLIFKNERTSVLNEIELEHSVLVKFPAIDHSVNAVRTKELTFTTESNFAFTLHNILLVDDPDLIKQIGNSFDGIIGREFFRNFTIEIDPYRNELSLYSHDVNLSDDYPLVHRLAGVNSSPHIILSSKFPWERFTSRKRLLLDTGYPGGIVIWSKRHFNNVTTKSEREELGDKNSGVFLKMNLQFNRLVFKQLPIFFGNKKPETSSRTHGLIGAGLLIHYKHVYDFKRKKLLLKPILTDEGVPVALSTAGIYTPNDETFITKDYQPREPNGPRIIINGEQAPVYQ